MEFLSPGPYLNLFAFRRAMRKSERKTKIEKPKQTLATTTPLVRGIFDSMFNEQLDETAAKSKKRRCGICEVISLFDVICYVKRVSRLHTVKLVLSGHRKINKTKIFKIGGSLVQVESIAECAILLTCIKRLLVLKKYF